MRGTSGRFLLKVAVLTFIVATRSSGFAQTSSQTKPTEAVEDVIRVETNLVQTDVTVIDKKGHVVTGLKPSQFELRVDSKAQPLSFVEEVITGGAREETQLKSAREGRVNGTPPSPTRSPADRLFK